MKRWSKLVLLFAALGLAFLLYRFPPGHAGFYPTCPFHSLTGWNCPGCGSTRAFSALLHGHVIAALNFNPLLPVFAIVSITLWIFRASLQHHEKATAWGLAVSLLLVTAARNVFHF